MNFKELLKKALYSLTSAEKSLITSRWSELSSEEKSKFADIAPAEKTEVKEITEGQLKTIVSDSIAEVLTALKSDLIAEVKSGLPEQKQETTKESAFEIGAKFIKDLMSGSFTPEQKAVTSLDASLGYTVPTELASSILEKRDKISKIRKIAFKFNLAGPFQLPIEGTGVTAFWVGENTEITESNPTTDKKTLNDYYLATRVLMPRQLLKTSAFNIVEYISSLCSRAIVRTEETAFVAGDGNGKPSGLRGTVGVGSEAQAGANFAYDDIVNLYYTIKEQYRQNGVFMTSTAGVKLLRKLKDLQGNPLFDVRDNSIFGKPVIESEDIPSNLGVGLDETEIWFFDPFYYWIKDGENMFMESISIPSKLQTELVIAEATDGVYTLPEAAAKLTAVV